MTAPSQLPEGPSPASLRRASVIAVVIAVVLVVTAVLPAEYGVDPTGIGRRIGLYSPNDLRRLENMPPRTDPGGDEYEGSTPAPVTEPTEPPIASAT